ncbi:MAG: orotate phosphoribosyltransferase [Aeriscardovia sp.]|nr:orotate phosphoribosyltransferase [Aeriscardovia sp.]
MTWNDPREELRQLVKKDIGDKPFSELSSVIFNHDGAVLAGHALIDVLEENGFDIDDFDAVGALTAASVPFVSSMITAAASRGQSLDGFALDFVFPGIKGTDIKGKRVILLDAWLSDLSYIQTSSIVTLTKSNELDLDFGVIKQSGATVCAILSLVAGGTTQAPSEITLMNPVTQKKQTVQFIHVFDRTQLQDQETLED